MDIELARHQWDDGRRTLQRAGSDSVAARALQRQVDIVSAELARRLGQVFTLAELVRVYEGADVWSLPLLHETLAGEVQLHASTAADAAFELYARRASDYAP